MSNRRGYRYSRPPRGGRSLGRIPYGLVKWAVGLALAALAACSADVTLVGDYKLVDLDGSNQAILGDAGMVKVSDVTAYSLSGGRILFETGALDAEVRGETITAANRCRYGFIDLNRRAVVRAEIGSALAGDIRARLKPSKKGVVSRSCLKRD